jgi:heme O synthase-like polyprenyltransferase
VGPKAAARWVMVHIVANVCLSLGLQTVSCFGAFDFAMAMASGLVFVRMGLRLLHQPSPTEAWPLFKY